MQILVYALIAARNGYRQTLERSFLSPTNSSRSMLRRWHICTTLRTLRDCRLIVCHHLRLSRMLNCRSVSPQDSHDSPRQLFLIGLLMTFEIPLQSGGHFIANSVCQSVRKTACGFLQIDVVTP